MKFAIFAINSWALQLFTCRQILLSVKQIMYKFSVNIVVFTVVVNLSYFCHHSFSVSCHCVHCTAHVVRLPVCGFILYEIHIMNVFVRKTIISFICHILYWVSGERQVCVVINGVAAGRLCCCLFFPFLFILFSRLSSVLCSLLKIMFNTLSIPTTITPTPLAIVWQSNDEKSVESVK